MKPKWIKRVRKIARIWSVVILGLGLLVLVSEVIEARTMELDPYPWFENLIPATLTLSIVGLAVAWRREDVGGGMAVGFAAVNLLLYIATGRTQIVAVVLILSPIVIPGLLFLFCWRGEKQLPTT